MRITYTLMFHRQIFYIVSLTKVGNDKWKNKRKDKFFNMVVPSGYFRYKRQQKQQDTTEQASLAQQAEPIFSPANPKIVALCSTKRLRMPIALSPTENGMTTTKRGQATR